MKINSKPLRASPEVSDNEEEEVAQQPHEDRKLTVEEAADALGLIPDYTPTGDQGPSDFI